MNSLCVFDLGTKPLTVVMFYSNGKYFSSIRDVFSDIRYYYDYVDRARFYNHLPLIYVINIFCKWNSSGRYAQDIKFPDCDMYYAVD